MVVTADPPMVQGIVTFNHQAVLYPVILPFMKVKKDSAVGLLSMHVNGDDDDTSAPNHLIQRIGCPSDKIPPL